MNILICYATYSGGTMAASQHLENHLQQAGHQVSTKQANEVQIEDFTNSDLTILASPSWDYDGQEGMPHQDFAQLHEQSTDFKANNQKFAILGLGDTNYTKFCGAVDHIVQWVQDWDGQLIGEPLKIDQYFMNEPEYNQQMSGWIDGIVQSAQQ